MKKTILALAFFLIASYGGAQTLLAPYQMRVSTNDYPLAASNTTLRAVLQAIAAEITTNTAKIAALTTYTNLIQSGTCTNGQTVTFSNAFSSTPFVAGMWVGAVVTNETGQYPVLYVESSTTTNFVLQATASQTNQIKWKAMP
jgi:hypothetical protein